MIPLHQDAAGAAEHGPVPVDLFLAGFTKPYPHFSTARRAPGRGFCFFFSVLTQDAAGLAAAALCGLGAQLALGVRTELAEERLARGPGVGFLHLSLERQRVPTGVLGAERHAAGINHPLKPAKRTSETLRNVQPAPTSHQKEQNRPPLAAGRAGKCQRAPGGSQTAQRRSDTSPSCGAGSHTAQEQREKRAFYFKPLRRALLLPNVHTGLFRLAKAEGDFFIAEGPRAESRLALFLVTSEDETRVEMHPGVKMNPPPDVLAGCADV